ncbi:hypothetical protein [Hoeflea sp.]|uniref:hypothetical protein n=1 Tax=Hoeflea sp. TaxID=1940281 RepID=UPI003BB06199
MKRLLKWLAGGIAVLLVAVLALLAPVGYVETMCRGSGEATPYQAILPPEHHRPETRTLMTVPEWQIVHAYEDYAEVIRTGAPHDFGYLASIGGFWSSLCELNEASAELGPVDGATKQMVHVIGVSFTVELMFKAAYENTLGRLAVLLRGDMRAPADELSAEQAKAYAEFLQQVPWYKWRFREDAAELDALDPTGLRDRERQFALGLEYGAKARYADLIATAVAAAGNDALTLRMVAAPGSTLPANQKVEVVERRPEGTVLETPRYRELTRILQEMALAGNDFIEIAGNDDILFSVLSGSPSHPGALHSEARQGFGDYRHLIMVKVTDLAEALRSLEHRGATLEHIHDY